MHRHSNKKQAFGIEARDGGARDDEQDAARPIGMILMAVALAC